MTFSQEVLSFRQLLLPDFLLQGSLLSLKLLSATESTHMHTTCPKWRQIRHRYLKQVPHTPNFPIQLDTSQQIATFSLPDGHLHHSTRSMSQHGSSLICPSRHICLQALHDKCLPQTHLLNIMTYPALFSFKISTEIFFFWITSLFTEVHSLVSVANSFTDTKSSIHRLSSVLRILQESLETWICQLHLC